VLLSGYWELSSLIVGHVIAENVGRDEDITEAAGRYGYLLPSMHAEMSGTGHRIYRRCGVR